MGLTLFHGIFFIFGLEYCHQSHRTLLWIWILLRFAHVAPVHMKYVLGQPNPQPPRPMQSWLNVHAYLPCAFPSMPIPPPPMACHQVPYGSPHPCHGCHLPVVYHTMPTFCIHVPHLSGTFPPSFCHMVFLWEEYFTCGPSLIDSKFSNMFYEFHWNHEPNFTT